jgi:hypothetical protein
MRNASGRSGNSAPVGVMFESLFAQIDARAFEEIGLDFTQSSRPHVPGEIVPLHAC